MYLLAIKNPEEFSVGVWGTYRWSRTVWSINLWS